MLRGMIINKHLVKTASEISFTVEKNIHTFIEKTFDLKIPAPVKGNKIMLKNALSMPIIIVILA